MAVQLAIGNKKNSSAHARSLLQQKSCQIFYYTGLKKNCYLLEYINQKSSSMDIKTKNHYINELIIIMQINLTFLTVHFLAIFHDWYHTGMFH